MKGEIYATVAVLNRGFDSAVESLKVLQEKGVLTLEYVSRHCDSIEEFRAGVNHMLAEKMRTSEGEDWFHFQGLRMAAEGRLKDQEPQTEALQPSA